MTETFPPGRPGIVAADKPRRARQPHHRHKTHAPFVHAHPLAKPGLQGQAAAPVAAPDQKGPDPQ